MYNSFFYCTYMCAVVWYCRLKNGDYRILFVFQLSSVGVLQCLLVSCVFCARIVIQEEYSTVVSFTNHTQNSLFSFTIFLKSNHNWYSELHVNTWNVMQQLCTDVQLKTLLSFCLSFWFIVICVSQSNISFCKILQNLLNYLLWLYICFNCNNINVKQIFLLKI